MTESSKTKRIFQNNKQIGGECTRTIQQLDTKETKQFWCEISDQKEHNRNAEWINSMKKQLQRFERGIEAIIH